MGARARGRDPATGPGGERTGPRHPTPRPGPAARPGVPGAQPSIKVLKLWLRIKTSAHGAYTILSLDKNWEEGGRAGTSAISVTPAGSR